MAQIAIFGVQLVICDAQIAVSRPLTAIFPLQISICGVQLIVCDAQISICGAPVSAGGVKLVGDQ